MNKESKLMRALRWLKPFVFVVAAALLFITNLGVTGSHLYWVTAYIFFVTLFIVFVLKRYREGIRPVSTPFVYPLYLNNRDRSMPLSEILLREFDYVKETAAQAMNDRHTMVNYFLLSAGVLLAGLGLMVSEEGGARFYYRYEALIALSITFNAVGWVYFMQVVRLRQAWCESARAMSHIKQFFVSHSGYPSVAIDDVFRWEVKSIPKAAKKMTVFYFSVLLISILSASAIALASAILLGIEPSSAAPPSAATGRQFHLIPLRDFLICLGIGFYHLVFQMAMYTAFLEERDIALTKLDRDKFEPFAGSSHESLQQREASRMKVEIEKEQTVFDDFFKIVACKVSFEKFDGQMSQPVRRLSFERGDSVAAVLFNRHNNSLILIEQFRYPAHRAQRENGWLYELVAGVIEAGETPEEVARREVLEETGYQAGEVKHLATVFPSPGGTSERVYVYFAEVGKKESAGGGVPEEHEDIRILDLPVPRVYQMLEAGKITDAKTVIGLLLARERNLIS
jgi:ADP-ribose pyrophosphatase